MLMTARDIVTRLPDADERRVRLELSGNLCRCTGYVGIVRAICAVLDERRRSGATTEQVHRHSLGPVGSGHPLPMGRMEAAGSTTRASLMAMTSAGGPTGAASGTTAARPRPGIVLRQSFVVDHPRERVFAFFGQLDEVVTCMPGAALTAVPRDGHVQGQLHIKLGPIAAAFAGEADIERDPTNHRGVIRGRGRDLRTGSTVVGEVSYVLVEEGAGAATRVNVEIGYALRGALAQVGRSRIVNDLAERLTAVFAKNIEARLSGGADSLNGVAAPQAELDVGALILSVIRARIRRVLDRLLGR
jgi:carbon-monoxide dehydrogenase small subunit